MLRRIQDPLNATLISHEAIIRAFYAESQLNNTVDLSYFLWEFDVQSRLGELGL